MLSLCYSSNKDGRDVGDPLPCAYYDASVHLLRFSRWLSLELLSDYIEDNDHTDDSGPDGLPPLSWKLTTGNRERAQDEEKAIVLKANEADNENMKLAAIFLKNNNHLYKDLDLETEYQQPIILDYSNYFAKGHRIRIEISSSNFPRFDRNLNTGGNNYDEAKGVIAHNQIHHSADYPSQIRLPIVVTTVK